MSGGKNGAEYTKTVDSETLRSGGESAITVVKLICRTEISTGCSERFPRK